MKFKIKIMIILSFVVIVSMSFLIVHNNYVSVSSIQPNNVITGSNNSYLITLKGVPSGNGVYPQLIIINNYSKYGINNNGSNIEFFDYSNYTHLYAWIQSINVSSLQVWIKNYNVSLIIDMLVLPSFENLFNANGYLGESPELSSIYAKYDNGKYLFQNYNNFAGTSGNSSILDLSAYPSSQYIQDNGLTIYANTTSTLTSYISYPTNILITDVEFYNPVNPPTFFPGLGFQDFNGITSRTGSNYCVFSVIGAYAPTDHAEVPFLHNNVSNSLYLLDNQYYVNVSSDGHITSATDNCSFTSYYIRFQNGGEAVLNDYVHFYYLALSNVSGNFNEPTFTITSLYHSIDFKLLGFPFSSLWNIMVNGTTYQADSSNIYLNMTNGYYNIIVNLPAGYSAITKGVLYVNGTNQVYKIFVSYSNNSGISNDIIYAIILASIIVAAAIYFSKRS